MTFTALPHPVSAIQYTGENAVQVATFHADHLQRMDLPATKQRETFIAETAKGLKETESLHGQWLVADEVSLRWIPDEIFSRLYQHGYSSSDQKSKITNPQSSISPSITQRSENGLEIVSIPILLEIPVDPLEGFTAEEAPQAAMERLHDPALDLLITLGGVPLDAVIPHLDAICQDQALLTDAEL